MDSIICDKINGLLFASAIADAMAGPHEGRSTKETRRFLQSDGWINHFAPYTPWFQHHWNVYQAHAPAGTYTDDSRMRLSFTNFMLDYAQSGHKGTMTREYLAKKIFEQYGRALKNFHDIDRKYQNATAQEEKRALDERRKERFLHIYFSWELVKTATSVYIPQNPALYSPSYQRINDLEGHDDYSPEWHLQPVSSEEISVNKKDQFHHGSYARGQEMPLGLIHLLPAAFYFPGQPQQAFRYILRIDFFDIGNAPYYPAVACALLAEILAGNSWTKISNELLEHGLEYYTGKRKNKTLDRIESGLKRAIITSRKFRSETSELSRKDAIPFLCALHDEFGTDDINLCTVDEMLFVPIALLDYANDDINFLIELGVNYGRDNDTVASIAALFGGALSGASALKTEWMKTVQQANPMYDIGALSNKICNSIIK